MSLNCSEKLKLGTKKLKLFIFKLDLLNTVIYNIFFLMENLKGKAEKSTNTKSKYCRVHYKVHSHRDR